jgi:hypothetical protein
MITEEELHTFLSKPRFEFATHGSFAAMLIWFGVDADRVDLTAAVLLGGVFAYSVVRLYRVWKSIRSLGVHGSIVPDIRWLLTKMSILRFATSYLTGIGIGLFSLLFGIKLTDALKNIYGEVPHLQVFGSEFYVSAVLGVLLFLGGLAAYKLSMNRWAARQVRMRKPHA